MSKRFNLIIVTIFLVAYIFPLLVCIKPIITGNIPFWYDPARDLLLAWDNLNKPTLIGPTTGIQGVFYGPFWIWLLSLGVFISKDPRIIDFIVQTIPYFTVFPFVLWKLSKNIFNAKISLILWILFILSFVFYANQLWSPNLAPLLFLLIFYFIVKTDLLNNKPNYIYLLLTGVAVTLMLSFLFSLAMALPVSLMLYYIIFFTINLLLTKEKKLILLKNWVVKIGTFLTGVIVILAPFLLFEIKHGFNQTKALITNLSQGYIDQTTSQTLGLNRREMFNEFINRMANLVHLSNILFTTIIFISFVYLIYMLIKRKIIVTKEESRILLFILTSIISIFIIFITSKNPVWSYRFIGVEIIGLLLIGFLAKKIKIIENFLMVGVVIIIFLNLYQFIGSFSNIKTVNSDFASRLDIVQSIYNDANDRSFTYFAKNAAIYTFDYDYIFKWLQKRYPNSRLKNNPDSQTVYLIIPEELRSDKVGFTENRTPTKNYQTIKKWQGIDRTLVIKRQRIN